MLDEDGQQVDTRSENSWVEQLGEISSTEYMECHLINATAPFIINSQLKKLMCRNPEADKLVHHRLCWVSREFEAVLCRGTSYGVRLLNRVEIVGRVSR
jgi:hypothetical protein